MPAKRKATTAAQSLATIGFEAKLWLTADKFRNNMDDVDRRAAVAKSATAQIGRNAPSNGGECSCLNSGFQPRRG